MPVTSSRRPIDPEPLDFVWSPTSGIRPRAGHRSPTAGSKSAAPQGPEARPPRPRSTRIRVELARIRKRRTAGRGHLVALALVCLLGLAGAGLGIVGVAASDLNRSQAMTTAASITRGAASGPSTR